VAARPPLVNRLARGNLSDMRCLTRGLGGEDLRDAQAADRNARGAHGVCATGPSGGRARVAIRGATRAFRPGSLARSLRFALLVAPALGQLGYPLG